MSKLSTAKDTVKGSIASLQTVLERYPILVTTNNDTSKTSLSFMLDILKILGVTEQDILKWLSELLAGDAKTSDGILSVLEVGVKAAILASFKETYTCAVNPILPDDVMLSLYDEESEQHPIRGEGIEVEIQQIDPFGLLNFCPVDKNESIFYFDSTENRPGEEYKPHTIYRSADFNAFLWYIINRSNFNVNSERLKCIWDNRNTHYRKFKKNSQAKDAFFNRHLPNSPTLKIKGVGVKKEFFACEYNEQYHTGQPDTSTLKVYLNADRYYKTSILGTNKTIFEFNVDYINSIRLFDSKTLVAQIINAVLGISNSFTLNLSIERRVMAKKIRSIIDKVIEAEDAGEDTSKCYYTFTNEEYEQMLSAAELQQKNLYPSGNEDGDLIAIDTAFTAEQIYKIEDAENLEEQQTAINNAFSSIATALSSTDETPDKDEYSFKLNIINKFINEVCTELCLQAISPKIMLLYAINEKIMNPNGEGEGTISIVEFMQKFQNLIFSIVTRIYMLVIQRLFDFVMGQIKPLITLFVQKLLLETIMYYRMLLESLLTACMSSKNGIETDNVVGADIIPELKAPEEGCRV